MRHGHITRTVRAAILAAVLIFTGASLGTAADAPARFSYQAINAEQLKAISWALGLFEEAGIELPDIEFVGHDDREPCHGRDGVARPTEDGAIIGLCAYEIGPPQEWMILHEIAHAWDYHSLDDERRAAFVELRGLTGWRDGAWHERGSENAAEIMVWGLIDRPVKPGHIYDNSCEDLLAGYLVLTGEHPLHGYTDACER